MLSIEGAAYRKYAARAFLFESLPQAASGAGLGATHTLAAAEQARERATSELVDRSKPAVAGSPGRRAASGGEAT